jgi:hypothetical protein
MSFDQCVNTSTYTGVQFTLGGTTGGCNLFLQVQTLSQQVPANRGTCTAASCYQFPKFQVQVGTAPVTVRWSDLAGSGLPATADLIKAEVIGLQWQFEIPPGGADGGVQAPCAANLTIDDVQFVGN